MKNIIAKIKAQFPVHTPVLPYMTAIPISAGQCREKLGDDARLWCFYNCTEAWRPLERWTPTAVRIAFQSEVDATLFRLAF